jgi:hypothetical protein
MARDPKTEETIRVAEKLEVIRTAARHDYAVADVGEMLAEIESGYLSAAPRETDL